MRLEVRQLKTEFPREGGPFAAIDGVTFSLRKGETLGLVGDSGCGKSVTALSILRLVQPPARISGEVLLNGVDLLKLDEKALCQIRGRKIAMIFQEAATALHPVATIGRQLIETIRRHRPERSSTEARREALELLHRVRLPDPECHIDEYVHQLSGGMRQRVMIALAISCRPEILIADEPTTALDAIMQTQILDLLRSLTREANMSLLFITHDLAVISEMCDRIAVMNEGRIVEIGTVDQIFQEPRHEFTRSLVNSTSLFSARAAPTRTPPMISQSLSSSD